MMFGTIRNLRHWGILSYNITLSNNSVYRVKMVVENGLRSCLELFRHNWLWKLKLYKGYIIVLLYELMHHNNVIMITCVMKVKENTRIILLYEQNIVKCL